MFVGSQEELLEEVRQMSEVLLHSETHITKIVGKGEAAQVSDLYTHSLTW